VQASSRLRLSPSRLPTDEPGREWSPLCRSADVHPGRQQRSPGPTYDLSRSALRRRVGRGLDHVYRGETAERPVELNEGLGAERVQLLPEVHLVDRFEHVELCNRRRERSSGTACGDRGAHSRSYWPQPRTWGCRSAPLVSARGDPIDLVLSELVLAPRPGDAWSCKHVASNGWRFNAVESQTAFVDRAGTG
jgi:hypothetical protein